MNSRKKIFVFVLAALLFIGAVFVVLHKRNSNDQHQQALSNSTSSESQKVVSESTPKTQANSKIVYLTLDADMNQNMHKKLLNKQVAAWYDPQLFDYLKTNKIPASFFMSGLFAETYSDLVKDLNSTGDYTFENHGYDESGFTPHCYKLDTLTTDAEKIDQVEKTQKILKDLTGRLPVYFRFPGICQSAHDDELIKKMGLKNNDGDIVASDPFNNNTKAIVANIYRQLKSGGVIIMHVGGPNAPKSLEVLKQIIPKLQSDGYSIEHL